MDGLYFRAFYRRLQLMGIECGKRGSETDRSIDPVPVFGIRGSVTPSEFSSLNLSLSLSLGPSSSLEV